jgi:hypothetical protein
LFFFSVGLHDGEQVNVAVVKTSNSPSPIYLLSKLHVNTMLFKLVSVLVAYTLKFRINGTTTLYVVDPTQQEWNNRKTHESSFQKKLMLNVPVVYKNKIKLCLCVDETAALETASILAQNSDQSARDTGTIS